MKRHMKRLGLFFGLFWSRFGIPRQRRTLLVPPELAKLVVVNGICQLLTACQMQGNFTVDVQTADTPPPTCTHSVSITTQGSRARRALLYTTTGQFTGDSHFSTVSSGVTIPAATTSECNSYPCTLPAGMYAIAMMATNCASSCAGLAIAEPSPRTFQRAAIARKLLANLVSKK